MVCAYTDIGGDQCGEAAEAGAAYCRLHSDQADAERVRNLRLERERVLLSTYGLEGRDLQSRLLEIAVLDTLALENTPQRARTLAYLAARVAPSIQNVPDDTENAPELAPHETMGRRLRRLQKEAFVLAIARGHSTAAAADAARIGRRTVLRWAEKDERFAAAWADAKESKGDWYEDRLREQALGGDTSATVVGLKMSGRFVERKDINVAMLQQVEVFQRTVAEVLRELGDEVGLDLRGRFLERYRAKPDVEIGGICRLLGPGGG